MDNSIVNKFQCIRVLDDDARVSEIANKSYDWNATIPYDLAPSKEEEIFKLKMHFQANRWNQVFEIEDYDKKKTELS